MAGGQHHPFHAQLRGEFLQVSWELLLHHQHRHDLDLCARRLVDERLSAHDGQVLHALVDATFTRRLGAAVRRPFGWTRARVPGAVHPANAGANARAPGRF